MLFDTHCHIQFRGLDADREVIINRCKEKNVLLNLVGTQKETSKRAVELAEQHDGMYASIGVHPNHLFPTYIDEEESKFMSREEDFDEAYYEELAQSKKVIAVGETGLDLFHVPTDIPVEAVLEKQKEVFLKHVRFAKKHQLTLVIHCREASRLNIGAHRHLIELLKSDISKIPPAVVHCYTGNWAYAQEYLSLGLYLGFTGVITFPPKKTDPKSQEDLLEVIRNMPLDRIVIETDAPYLAPQAYRGKRSEPWMVEEQVKKIAELRGLSVQEVEDITTKNAKRLFGIS